jgi:hypothetical protein
MIHDYCKKGQTYGLSPAILVLLADFGGQKRCSSNPQIGLKKVLSAFENVLSAFEKVLSAFEKVLQAFYPALKKFYPALKSSIRSIQL